MSEERIEDFDLENVRESGNRKLLDGAIALLRDDRKVSPEQAEQRLKHLLLVATERTSGRVAGMLTTRLESPERLRIPLWAVRSYVGADFRRRNIGLHMLFAALDHHQKRFASGEDRSGRGLYLEIDNPALQQSLNEAVWRDSRFVFIGLNGRGDHCRVRYFEGARID
jgi:hypothetical protein